MILRRLLPDAGEEIDLDQPGGSDRLAALYRPADADWLRINSVLSVSGGAAGQDGTSDSLTNRVDRALLAVIRDLADVVLVGAGSVRTEGYMIPRRSVLAVVTGSGDLGGHRLDETLAPGRLLVLCPREALPALDRTLGGVPHETVVVEPGQDGMPPASIIAALSGRGLRSVVCEGGPSLATRLLAADLVDELCLTTSPTLTSSAAPFLTGRRAADRRLHLDQLLADASGALYARWRVLDEPAG